MNLPAKMAVLAAFILRPCHWDADAAAWARLLPHDSPKDYGEHFSQLVTSGRAQAYELVGPEGRAGVLVCSVDKLGELVVEGAIARESHRDLTADFLPQIEAQARALGCRTIRFHTMRAGLVAKALQKGFRICEVIVRKDLRHV